MIDVSVCIPVYNAEQYLDRCIRSAIKATEKLNAEIIVVNDGSPCSKSNYTCEQILNKYSNIIYIKHDSNKGLFEARRSAVYKAQGKYIMCLDSDDMLLPNGLFEMCHLADTVDADIVQGTGVCNYKCDLQRIKVRVDNRQRFVSKVPLGLTKDNEVHNLFLHGKITTYMCNKLIKRKTYLKALQMIPNMYCTLHEDYLQCFVLTKLCKRYFGAQIPCIVYNVDTGITTVHIVKSIAIWKQICSSLDVFKFLLSLPDLSDDDIKVLKSKQCTNRTSVKNWLYSVTQDIKKEAEDYFKMKTGSE